LKNRLNCHAVYQTSNLARSPGASFVKGNLPDSQRTPGWENGFEEKTKQILKKFIKRIFPVIFV
jgi:hypothetical protein